MDVYRLSEISIAIRDALVTNWEALATLLAFCISLYAVRVARESNQLSSHSNQIARESIEISKDSRKLAKDSNSLSAESNDIARRSMEISKESKKISEAQVHLNRLSTVDPRFRLENIARLDSEGNPYEVILVHNDGNPISNLSVLPTSFIVELDDNLPLCPVAYWNDPKYFSTPQGLVAEISTLHGPCCSPNEPNQTVALRVSESIGFFVRCFLVIEYLDSSQEERSICYEFRADASSELTSLYGKLFFNQRINDELCDILRYAYVRGGPIFGHIDDLLKNIETFPGGREEFLNQLPQPDLIMNLRNMLCGAYGYQRNNQTDENST